jgi:glycosyltransferase involved in cell wall biosynthesis
MHQERGLRGTMFRLPLFYPEPAPPRDARDAPNAGRPYFLFTGRLEKMKGVQAVIPVFRGLADVDLLIAGTGDFEGALRSMAANAANIKFLGRLDQTQLQALYRGAIATVVPSLCYETFALIVAESFSKKTPVIVHAQSSLAELISAHGGGLQYCNTDELHAAIERLRTDAALRERLGREGRAAYEAEFAEDLFLTRYLDVVHALMEAKRARVPIGQACTAGPSPLLAGRRVFLAPEPTGNGTERAMRADGWEAIQGPPV